MKKSVSLLALFALSGCSVMSVVQTKPDGSKSVLVIRGNVGIATEDIDGGSGGLTNNSVLLNRQTRPVAIERTQITMGDFTFDGILDQAVTDREVATGVNRHERTRGLFGLGGKIVESTADIAEEAINAN